MRTHPMPLVCGDLYESVRAAALYRCTCTGECGKRHPQKHASECRQTGTDARPLTIAPRDLSVPLHQATALPPQDLTAWCAECYTPAARRAHAAAQPSSPGGEFALFDVDALS